MNLPPVSVLVPSYNHADYIEPAIDSVLASDVDDIEIVVVDDGSTDDTLHRLERYEEDSRVRVYTQENCGAHSALNRALDLARGDLVFVLNSDDAFSPNRIPALSRYLGEHPETAVVTTWIRLVDRSGRELGIKKGWSNLPPWPSPTKGPFLSDLDDATLALLETNHISTSSNLAFRQELIRDAGLRFHPLRYTHDWEFALAASAVGRVDLIEHPLLNYRVHPSNTIAEGATGSVGHMRFEIQWTVARHAFKVLCQAEMGGRNLRELRTLLWQSMPSFGREDILDRLLLLRGSSEESPASYDALADPLNPLFGCLSSLLTDSG